MLRRAATDRVSLALAAWTLVGGCAPSGEDPRTRTAVWEPESASFRVRYLDPPWELVEASGEAAFLRVRSNAMVTGGLDGGPGKFELRVSRQPGEPAALAAVEERRLRAAGATIVDGPRGVTTLEDVDGVEVLAARLSPTERSYRVVFLPLLAVGSPACVRLAFEATPDLDHPEVDAMIELVEIGPFGP